MEVSVSDFYLIYAILNLMLTNNSYKIVLLVLFYLSLIVSNFRLILSIFLKNNRK